MSEPVSPAPATPPVVGQGYDFDAVRLSLQGEKAPPYFVIHKEGAILGLCLGRLWHPRIEDEIGEVWVGKKGDLAKWGEKLAATTGPLPVYVRREERGPWFYLGLHEVTGSSAEAEAIQQRLQPPTITAISRIVFLKRL